MSLLNLCPSHFKNYFIVIVWAFLNGQKNACEDKQIHCLDNSLQLVEEPVAFLGSIGEQSVFELSLAPYFMPPS